MTADDEGQTIPALEVRDLTASARSRDGRRRLLLDEVGFHVMAGEALGIVGESGSGKSLTSLTALGIVPSGVAIESGEVLLGGEDLLQKSHRELREVRGSRISMVLQDPMGSLDPAFSVRSQMSEALPRSASMSRDDRTDVSVRMLARMQISSPRQRVHQYPHELSGGILQRVSSAIALAGEPEVLIADEATTALDVTTQAAYLTLLRQLQREIGFALIMISHDLMVVRQMCTRIVVMYAGQVVEEGPLEDVLTSPKHPYTKALFDAVPRLDDDAKLNPIDGQPPDPSQYPDGCRFAPRCHYATELCRARIPDVVSEQEHRSARCFGTRSDGWIDW